jgi:dihydroorotate dehydrogenase electron transfer subunit
MPSCVAAATPDILARMPVDAAARVIANTALSADYNLVALEAPDLAVLVRPGQFVMIKPHTGHHPLLRRPFSVFELLRTGDGRPHGISILSKRVGTSTTMIAGLREGDEVACLGPLGQPFEPVESPTLAWMVAGGVGLAPFVTLAEALLARGNSPTLFYGARRATDLHCADLFERMGVAVVYATEDGSRGTRGFVTAAMTDAFARLPGGRDVRVYACGPTPMMRAVNDLTVSHGHRCDVSLEQVMGCGLGGCYSCVVRATGADGHGHFVRSCLAGPIFDGRTIDWAALGH